MGRWWREVSDTSSSFVQIDQDKREDARKFVHVKGVWGRRCIDDIALALSTKELIDTNPKLRFAPSLRSTHLGIAFSLPHATWVL